MLRVCSPSFQRTRVGVSYKCPSCLREFLDRYSDSYTGCSPGCFRKNLVGTDSWNLLVVCFVRKKSTPTHGTFPRV